jgi:hypothetical protein
MHDFKKGKRYLGSGFLGASIKSKKGSAEMKQRMAKVRASKRGGSLFAGGY